MLYKVRLRGVAAVLHWSPVAFRRLLRRMLSLDPAARPPLQQCLDDLGSIVDAYPSGLIGTLRGRVRELETVLVRDDDCTSRGGDVFSPCIDIHFLFWRVY